MVSENTLDLIISESHDRICEVECCDPLGTTNEAHFVLTWEYKLAEERKEPEFSSKKYAYSKGDYGTISNKLCGIEWKSQFEGKDANDCYKLFKAMYESLCESHIPKKSSRILKRRATWMNEEILAMSRRKKELDS